MLCTQGRMQSAAASFDTLCVVLELFPASAETLMVSGRNYFSLR